MLKAEWQAILKNKFLWLVLLALAIIPALYNWIFLSSMWDPYGKLKDLPVAVVNMDAPSKLNGKDFKLADDVSKEMKKGKALDYHFVSEKEAAEGLKDGKYYLSVTFPKAFSSQAASLMSDKPEQVQLDYQTSEGHNYISAKMGTTAMTALKDEVAQNITQDYSRAIFDNINSLKVGMNEAATGSAKLSDGATKSLKGSTELASHMQELSSSSLAFSDGMDQMSLGLGQYLAGVATAEQGASQLAAGNQAYVSGVNQLAGGSQTLTDKSKALGQGIDQLGTAATASQQLAQGSQSYVSGVQKLSDSTQSLTDNAQKFQQGLKELGSATTGLSQLEKGSQDLLLGLTSLTAKTELPNGQIDQLTTALTQLNQAIQAENISQDLTTMAQAEAEAIENLPDLSLAQKASVLNALQQSTASSTTALTQKIQALQTAANQALPAAGTTLGSLSSGMAQVNSVLSSQITPGAQSLSTGLSQLNQGLTSGSQQVQTAFGQFDQGLQQVNQGAQELSQKGGQLTQGSQALSQKLSSGSQQLQTGFSQFCQGLQQVNQGAQSLNQKGGELTAGSQQLSQGLDQLQGKNSSLTAASQSLSQGGEQLASGSTQLATGSQQLQTGLGSLNQGAGQLSSSLATGSQSLNQTNSKQANADKISNPVQLNHSDHDNSPANGVGMAPYMIAVALFVGAISANVMLGVSLSKRQWKSGRDFLLAKIGTNGVVAVLQAIIVTGAVYALGLRANHFFEMLGGVILISLAFTAIVTFLNIWLGKVGAFVSLLLLIVQLAGSAGTYPLQLSAKIFQMLNPWLPMTYAIRLLRQAISLQGAILPYAGLMIALMLVFGAGLWLLGKRQNLLLKI